MNLNNSTILITGGTSGIGLELVKQLSEQGAEIIVTGRNAELLHETKKRFPAVHTFQSDVSDPRDIERLYKDMIQQFPRLNVIVNNAGAMRLIDVRDPQRSLEDVTREIDTNLSGTIRMVQQFLPHLLKQPSAAIVNVSSGIAFMPYSIAPVYSASKAGVHAYTLALRLQLQKTPVKVLEVIPPGVKTNLQHDWHTQPNPGQMMDVDKMVRIVVNGLQKDTLEIQPLLIRIVRLASRLFPGLLLRFGHREFEKHEALTVGK